MSHGSGRLWRMLVKKRSVADLGRLFFAPQYDVDSSVAAMAWMGLSDARDPVCTGAGFKPVAYLTPDCAPSGFAVWNSRFRRLPCNHEQDAQITGQCGRKRLIQHCMRAREGVTVKVDCHVRRQRPATDAALPSTIENSCRGAGWTGFYRPRRNRRQSSTTRHRCDRLSHFDFMPTRPQRANGSSKSAPKRLFLGGKMPTGHRQQQLL